jgi:hypothetical protein
LWQRIPNPVKAEHAELSKIWAVGRALWERNNPAAFATIGSTPWPDHVQPIMAAVKGMNNSRSNIVG